MSASPDDFGGGWGTAPTNTSVGTSSILPTQNLPVSSTSGAFSQQVADEANANLASGMSPDQAMKSIDVTNVNQGQGIQVVFNPHTGKFELPAGVAKLSGVASATPPAEDTDGWGSPVNSNANASSGWGSIVGQQSWESAVRQKFDQHLKESKQDYQDQTSGLTGVENAITGTFSSLGQQFKEFGAGIGADVSNYAKVHQTENVNVGPDFYKTAKDLGISGYDLNTMGLYPQLDKNTLTKYSLGSAGIQGIYDNAVKSVGGNPEETRKSIEAGMQGDFKDANLLNAVLHKNLISQGAFLVTHPEWQATKTYETVKSYQLAQNILTNHFVPPGQDWKTANTWAKAVTEYAKSANLSPEEQVKQLWQSITTEPDKTVKGFLFGMAMDPELLAVGGMGKLGDVVFGQKAASAVSKAKLFASGMGTEALDAEKLGASASSAAKTAARFNAARKGLNFVAPIAGGAGINAAIASVQGQTDKGYATQNEVSGAAATGALIGLSAEGGAKLLGKSATYDGKGNVKPVNTVQEHMDVNPPGEPIPTSVPVTDHFNVPATGGVGIHAIHMDENIPNTFSVQDRDGKSVDVPAKEIVARVHESVEYPLMHLTGAMSFDSIKNLVDRIKGQGRLTQPILNKLKAGDSLSYQDAHKIATWAENKYVSDTYNIDPEEYQKAWQPHIEKAEAEGKAHNENVPQDLDTKPYDDMGVTAEQLGDKGTRPQVDKSKIIKAGAATGAAALAGAYVYNSQDKEEAAKHLGEAIFVSPFLKAGGKDDLFRAEEMHRSGASPREIKLATGLDKIPGGDWAYNMSTAYTVPMEKVQALVESRKPETPIASVLSEDNPILKHYPELNNLKVVRDTSLPYGGFYDNGNEIHVSDKGSPSDVRSTIIHELQHAIQLKEGWALGGDPKAETRRLEEALQKEAAETTDPAYKNYLAKQIMNQSYLDLQGYKNYQDLAGEGQARAAQDVRDVPQEQLDKTPLEDISTYKNGPFREWNVRKEGEDVSASANVPEEQLIQQAKDGDRNSLNKLLADNHPTLLKFTRKIAQTTGRVLGNDPEDLAQQTMIRAMQNIDQFQGNSKFSTWLYKIADNIAKDNTKRELDHRLKTTSFSQLKKSGGTSAASWTGEDVAFDPTERPVESEADKVSGNIRTPEEDATNASLGKEIDSLVDGLPDHLKKPMLMWATKDMSQADIAKELGIGVQEVKNRLFQGRKLLYGKLSPETRGMLNKQRGSIDLDTVKKLAKLGLLAAGTVAGANYFGSQGDSKVRGALLGFVLSALAVEIPPRKIAENIKYIWSGPTQTDVRDFLNNFDGDIAVQGRAVQNLSNNIKKLVPKKADRVVLTHALEGTHTGPLSAEQRSALGMLKSYYNEMGLTAYANGILDDLQKLYVNHEWVHDKKFNDLRDTLYAHLSAKDRHGLKRVVPSYQFGIDKGLTPVTLDAADLVRIYGDSMNRSLATLHLFDKLKNSKIVDGQDVKGNRISKPMIMLTRGTAKHADAPSGYVQIDHPSLRGYSAHPSIYPSLKFVLNARSNSAFIHGIQVLNTAMKRAEVSISFFHPNSLLMAFAGANPWFNHGMFSVGRNLSDMVKSFAGKDRGKQAYLNGTVGDQTDLFLRNGLTIDTKEHIGDEDVNGTGFYAGLHATRDFMDRNLPMGGLIGDKYIQLNHTMDKIIWENLHTGLKLTTAMNVFEQLKRSWAKELDKNPATVIPGDDELARIAGEHVNRTFGGLNWRRLADDSTTKIGRAMALAVADPASRRVLQFLLFAPDWTVSTIRAFADALPGKGSVIKGLFNPKTSGDLARQYILRSSVMYFTMFNAINMALSGHPIWKNEDPFYIDMGNGEKTPANKHFMEVPRAIYDAVHEGGLPGKWLAGKIGVLPSEVLDQLYHKEYLSTGEVSPPMKGWKNAQHGGDTLGGFANNAMVRGEHFASRFGPFGLSELTGHGLHGLIMQSMGIPIYGTKTPQTPEEWQEYHAKKSAAARKAAITREKNRMKSIYGGQ